MPYVAVVGVLVQSVMLPPLVKSAEAASMQTVTTLDELKALYGEPGEAAVIKVADRVTPAYRRLTEAAPFVALATVRPEGLDCWPRGDPGQVGNRA
jgi:hypothetical protein